ncbi:hypothetical protein N7468_009598 [Penicillium chermesinum]|uniref:NACHT domain-containing protein n=1 Tax=Penicillium chermesinum TaxID=63820 RepID=A0A9W9NI18_9EURO|nr:uncharacterized protein N7468_009598 [Penicillium chermesinum]KAJ5220394.1 hypothetical protein N7468_009598 [Penicillium chermesinum]
MPDPLAITSLVLEVGKIVADLIKYGKAVKSAQSDVAKLTEELLALKGILEQLSAQAKGEDNATITDPHYLKDALLETETTLQSLLSDLGPPTSRLGQIKRKLEWPFARDTFEAHIARIERTKSFLMMILMSDARALQQDMHGRISDLTRRLEEDLQVRKDEKISVAHRELCKWISPVDTASVHRRAAKERVHNTGAWFREGIFKDWLQQKGPAKQILFLQGKSGAGKTTLFSNIVDGLSSSRLGENDAVSAFFYCQFSDPASHEPVNILGSFVAQIAEWFPAILDDILPEYEATMHSKTRKSAVDIDTLEEAIVKHVRGRRPVLFMIDAINENAAAIKNDIGIFTSSTLKKNRMLRNLPKSLQEHIQTKIVEGADGSFRWADLSLKNLCACQTPAEVREALKVLPETLQDVYASILERVSTRDREWARSALLWVTFAKRPLVLEELSQIVLVKEETTALDDEMKLVFPRVLLEICQGLIEEGESGKLYLAHASVREFLTSPWIRSPDSSVHYFGLDPKDADRMIMIKCLHYLCLENFRSGYVGSIDAMVERDEDYPFLDYAANFWTVHCQSHSLDDQGAKAILRLFDLWHLPRRGNYGTWAQAIAPENDVERIESSNPLYYAARFGLSDVLKELLKDASLEDIECPGGRFGSTPFFVACWMGHFDTAELLLEAGANPYVVDPSTGFMVYELPGIARSPRIMAVLANPLPGTTQNSDASTSTQGQQGEGQDMIREMQKTAHRLQHLEIITEADFTPRTLLESPPQRMFEDQLIYMFPKIDDMLVARLGHLQRCRYRLLMILQQKHDEAVRAGSCQAEKHCISLQSNLIPQPRLYADKMECPVCFEVQQFDTIVEWQKHIQTDAALFACTFAHCPVSFPNEKNFILLGTKEGWVRHETLWHWRVDIWKCPLACDYTTYRQEKMFSHLVEHHHVQMSEEEVWKMMVPCEQRPEELPSQEECQFCGANFGTWKTFMAHVGSHLDKLAIPILRMIKQDGLLGEWMNGEMF